MLGLGSNLTAGVLLDLEYSLLLDGTGDYLYTNDSVTTTNNMTFSAWINRSATGNMAILSKHDGSGGNIFIMGLYDTDKFHVRVRNGSHSETTYNTLNEWKHVAVVLESDGSTTSAKLYLNGALSWTESMGSNIMGTTTGNAWSIGQEWDGGSTSDHFNGKIDEVAIWNAPLDGDSIEAIYNYGKPFDLTTSKGDYTDSGRLQMFLKMNNNALDSSGNGHNGTLVGDAAFSSDTPDD